MAVQRHASIAFARHQLLVIGTHGLAPTVWLAALTPLRPTAASFGASLTFPDVIELYNSDATDRDVSGLSLSDDPALPAQYVLPAGTMIP